MLQEKFKMADDPDSPEIKARQIYNQGVKILNGGAPGAKETAYQFFCASVECDENFAEGWFAVGVDLSDRGLWDAAVSCWKKCVEIEPRNVSALNNIGHRLYWLGRLPEARKYISKAVELAPESGYGWCNLSLIENVEGNFKKAISSARKGFELCPDNINEMALAFALMFAGRYAEGMRHFESRYEYKLPQFLEYPYPQWQGQNTGELFLVAEQGMGDALSFLRFVPRVSARCRKVNLFIHPELLRVVTEACRYLGNVEVRPLPAPFVPADYWSTLSSLPVALGLTDKEIIETRHMVMPDFSSPVTWKKSGPGIHIGISWGGASANEIDRFRSIDVKNFFPLSNIKGVHLYSLQVGNRAGELHTNGGAGLIRDLSPYIRDVGDTIGILHNLDMVICCESAMRHICGAVDKLCWVPYSYNGGDWRCGRNQKYPLWDKNTELFRQDQSGTWEGVFRTIEYRLGKLIQNKFGENK
jgi:tetratricopeptide (TPR) repeat protein